MTYLEQNHSLTEYQHGYVKEKSTFTALIRVIDVVLKGFDKRLYTQIAFRDRSRAFDSITPCILKDKLNVFEKF